jgi:hypothetical protein
MGKRGQLPSVPPLVAPQSPQGWGYPIDRVGQRLSLGGVARKFLQQRAVYTRFWGILVRLG